MTPRPNYKLDVFERAMRDDPPMPKIDWRAVHDEVAAWLVMLIVLVSGGVNLYELYCWWAP